MQPNGNIYYGEWRYGERHGWGVSVMSNGRVYEGGFQHDKRNGWGMFRWPGGQNSGGDTYIGGTLVVTRCRCCAIAVHLATTTN